MILKQVSVKDVCNFVGGSQPPKSEFKSIQEDGYIRLIQTRDYKTNNFLTFIPKEHAKKICQKDDVMIGRYGPPIFQILRGLEGAYNVALMKAVPKNNILNDYLYYFLKQETVFNYVEGLSLRTGGQTGVDVDSLNNYPILLPDLEYQRNVVEILKTIDSKIDMNNQKNSILENISSLVYNYWFVQFDYPDASGKPYKTNGGKLEFNQKLNRKIPAGWEVGSITNIGKIVSGSTPPTSNNENFDNDGIAWVTPDDLSNNIQNKFISKGKVSVSERGLKAASLHIMPKGTVLLTSRAPVGYMAISRGEITTNQGFKSFVPNNGYSTPYVYYTLKAFLPTIVNNSSGSKFKEISASMLELIHIWLSPPKLIEEFTNIVGPIFDQQNLLEEENEILVNLRNWLLPMLMNGQVQVS